MLLTIVTSFFLYICKFVPKEEGNGKQKLVPKFVNDYWWMLNIHYAGTCLWSSNVCNTKQIEKNEFITHWRFQH